MATTIQTNGLATADSLVVPSDAIYRLTVAQYHQMIEAGILTDDDPVELLEGWLVQKMSKKPPHTIATRKTRRALERVVPAGWEVDSQEPFTTEESEPEPDGMVYKENDEERHPFPAEVALAVEVADTSLRRDRTTKKRIYARASIAAYWIINLNARQVEVFADPTGPAQDPAYHRRRVFHDGETVPLVIENREIARIPVRDLLP